MRSLQQTYNGKVAFVRPHISSRKIYSPPTSAEVKNTWSYAFTPRIRFHGVVFN